jgi:hypothetical protein
MVCEFARQGRIEMTSGLMATIGVFALVVLFGLVILYDRKKIKKEEGPARVTTTIKKTPKEVWDAHVERLSKEESQEM